MSDYAQAAAAALATLQGCVAALPADRPRPRPASSADIAEADRLDDIAADRTAHRGIHW